MCSANADVCPNEKLLRFALFETAVSLKSRHIAAVLIAYPDISHNMLLNLLKKNTEKLGERRGGIFTALL